MTVTSNLQSPLKVEIRDTPIRVGRDPASDVRLLHPTVSRLHALLKREGGQLSVEDLDSRFGTFVNEARIRACKVQSGDRIQFGTGVAYRVNSSGLALEEAPHGVRLTVSGITVAVNRSVPLRDRLEILLSERRKSLAVSTVLVADVSFDVAADEFVGILAPSGAGKSTLLNCLAGYLVPTSGRIVCDGNMDALEREAEYRSLLGHVPQSDIVHQSLTVRENLCYAAQLRLGADLYGAAEDEAVSQVLERVGLADHADKPVRVISGGQKKRLSVAIELLARPRLLLLDEPTTGLDPATEAALMEQLRSISRRGTTVICTTHLMDNLRLFDRVVVLGLRQGVGRVAFVDPPDNLFDAFGCGSFADLYDILASGRFTAIGGGHVSSTVPVSETPHANGSPAPTPCAPESPHSPSLTIKRTGVLPATSDIEAAPAWGQLHTILHRAFRLLWRDRGLHWSVALQPMFLGALTCVSQYAETRSTPLVFFALIVVLWMGTNNSIRDLIRERKLYVRERTAGLRGNVFLASKCIYHLLVGMVQTAILLLVIRLFAFLAEPALALELQEIFYPWLFAVFFGVYAGGIAIGLCASALVRTEETAVALLPLLILPQLLISAIGTGRIEEVFHPQNEAYPFRPLVVEFRDPKPLSLRARFVDVLSLGCFSRPGILLADPQHSTGKLSRAVLVADAAHLTVLVLGAWTAAVVTFQWAERRWSKLIDID